MDGGKLQYNVWRYYRIGDGKRFDEEPEPISLKADITVPFQHDHLSFGKATEKTKKSDIIYCSEPMCVKSFTSVYKMLKHLDFEKHDFQQTKSSSMEKVKDNWVKRFCLDSDVRSLPSSEIENERRV